MYEDVKEYLAWTKETVDREISKLEEELRDKFLLDVGDIMRGGKRFRPALTLLSAQAIGGDDAWQNAVDYAIAVEMMHSFSLNIDDILDMDKMRRGKPSEWVMYGLMPAFLAGIGGITQAFALGSKNHKAMKVLNETIQAMASGAVKEMVTGNVFKRDLLLNIIVLKTGALMATAAQMGAIAVNAPSSVEEAFRKYGLNVGIAYQMQDDMNDILLSMKDMKPHGDLKDFRLTMPLYIIHKSVPSVKDVIDLFLGKKIPFDDFISGLMAAGGTNLFTKVNDEIEKYVGKAVLAIKDLTLHERYRNILMDLPYYMIDAMKQEMVTSLTTRATETVEIHEKEPEEEEDEGLPEFNEWLKTLPPSQIAAVSLLKVGVNREEIIEKTNVTEKELEYLVEILEKYKEGGK